MSPEITVQTSVGFRRGRSQKMKLLLVICLVASAFAAPAERSKRNILPGDSRYNDEHHHHHHHDDHAHHENEIEIASALGGYVGSFAVPSTDYGIPGFQPGTPLGSSDFLQQDVLPVNVPSSSYDTEVVGNKVPEQAESVSESVLPAVNQDAVSITSGGIAETDYTSSGSFDSGVAQGNTEVDANTNVSQDEERHEQEEQDKEVKVEAPVSLADAEVPSSTSAPAVESAVPEAKLPPQAVPSYIPPLNVDGAENTFKSTPESSVASSFGSSFDQSLYSSSFGAAPSYTPNAGSFDQFAYNPTLNSGFKYTPSYDSFNVHQYDTVSYTPEVSAYSGFGQGFNQQTIVPQAPVTYSQNVPYVAPQSFGFQAVPQSSVGYTNHVHYSAPQSFGFQGTYPVAKDVQSFPLPASVEVNSNLKQSYLSPAAQPAPVSHQHQQSQSQNHGSIEQFSGPEVKINEGSFSGINQQTDANGGYIY